MPVSAEDAAEETGGTVVHAFALHAGEQLAAFVEQAVSGKNGIAAGFIRICLRIVPEDYITGIAADHRRKLPYRKIW